VFEKKIKFDKSQFRIFEFLENAIFKISLQNTLDFQNELWGF